MVWQQKQRYMYTNSIVHAHKLRKDFIVPSDTGMSNPGGGSVEERNSGFWTLTAATFLDFTALGVDKETGVPLIQKKYIVLAFFLCRWTFIHYPSTHTTHNS